MRNSLLKAYQDTEFLKRDELRAVRLQTEMLKPQIFMDEEGIASTVCVFGSARTPTPEQAARALKLAREKQAAEPEDPALKEAVVHAEGRAREAGYYTKARQFGRLISEYGQRDGMLEFVVCTGGGPGIMEAANRGAHDAGCKSVGLNITLKHEQYPNPYISPELNFTLHYFSIRKMHFLLRAKALCAFPGGFGTMDELFETLTLIQTEKSPGIPVILFGEEFWGDLINWQLFVDRGMISPEDLDLFTYAEEPEEGFRRILDFYGLS